MRGRRRDEPGRRRKRAPICRLGGRARRAAAGERAVFVYVADPMCSWCYGFGRELESLRARFPAVPLRLVMGGLRAYNTKPMDARMRQAIFAHWDEVARVCGRPFDRALLSRADFAYDTEPACRAVVTVRTLAPALTWPMLSAIQHAFYAQARDVTRTELLRDVYLEVRDKADAADSPTPEKFEAEFVSDKMRDVTRADFALAKEWEVHGFPTLFARHDGHFALLAAGYTKADTLIERAVRFFDTPA